MSGVLLLQRLDLLLLHVHGGEHEINHGGDFIHVVLGGEEYQAAGLLGDGSVHGPAGAHRVLVPLTCGTGAGGHCGELEPGMVLQQGDEALAHHSGGADDADFIFFHANLPPVRCAGAEFRTCGPDADTL